MKSELVKLEDGSMAITYLHYGILEHCDINEPDLDEEGNIVEGTKVFLLKNEIHFDFETHWTPIVAASYSLAKIQEYIWENPIVENDEVLDGETYTIICIKLL